MENRSVVTLSLDWGRDVMTKVSTRDFVGVMELTDVLIGGVVTLTYMGIKIHGTAHYKKGIVCLMLIFEIVFFTGWNGKNYT